MKSNCIKWTDQKSQKTYIISENYIKRYSKNISNSTKYKMFCGSSRIFNYLPQFKVNLDECQQYDFSLKFRSFIDRRNDFTEALRRNESNLIVVNESQIDTLSTKDIKNRFKAICQHMLPAKLTMLTLGDLGEQDDRYKNLKVVDWVIVVDDSEVSPAITFHVPVFSNSQIAADNMLKELTTRMRAAGYEYSSQEVMSPNIQPFDVNVVILALQFEAMSNVQAPDFKDTHFLYHVSPSKNFKSIKKNGLIPQSSSSQFAYNGRVYLFNKTSMLDVIEYGQWKTIDSFVEDAPDLMFCVWKVDMHKLMNIPQFKTGQSYFLRDVMSTQKLDDSPDETAVFTSSTIPSSVIDDEVLVFKIGIDKQVKMKHKVINKDEYDDIDCLFSIM